MVLVAVTALLAPPAVGEGRQRERLGRGVVAVRLDANRVYVGWRLLATDSPRVTFDVYRVMTRHPPHPIGSRTAADSTDLIDSAAPADWSIRWIVQPMVDGRPAPQAGSCTLPAKSKPRPYLAIPLRTPAGCRPGDASVGDLDGDGDYEIVLKQEQHPRDNSHAGPTGRTRLQTYKLDGKLLWQIDLGPNIREGAHYTSFVVYDLDGDGRAEVACRTADGTVDGRGRTIGDAKADHRNPRGYVLTGPEFLTIFDGRTGAALATTAYLPPRGRVKDWGDDYGNRVDRFLACVAYLDGRRPSLVMCRGYYTRSVLVAWNWRGGTLSRVWTFDSDAGGRDNRRYRGQGNHGLSVADVDGDGRDEIVYGACAIDDNGKGLYSTGLGHGDAMHVTDIDPDRPGLEVFGIHEHVRHPHGANLRDAATGKVLWSLPSRDVARGLAADIDPRHKGLECWARGGGLRGLYSCRGERIDRNGPRSCNMAVWWDGDVLRELLDGTTIAKWDSATSRTRVLLRAEGCRSINHSKANPCLVADILGDWREEVLWPSADGRELRLYTTTIPARRRMCTLMHDSVYRLSVAWQNVGYNQPAHTGFYLGAGMAEAPWPRIVPTGPAPSRPRETKP